MSKRLTITFQVHSVVALILGAGLLITPGRFLGIFGWLPVDPLISRILGAAVLGLGWASYRAWRSADWEKVSILVEAEAIFTILACVGLLRHTLFWWYPWYVWLTVAILAAFAVAWIVALVKKN